MPFYGLQSPFHVSGYDCSRHLSGDAGRAAYKVLCIFFHDFMRNARLVVVFSFDVSGGHDLHEVLVSVVILGEQDEVVVSSVVLVLELMVIVTGHIDFAAYDRLHLRKLLRHLQEFLHSVHVSMVCDGQGGHAEFLGSFEKT